MIRIEKYDPERIYTAIYQEGESKTYYVKRFKAELTERKIEFIDPEDKLVFLTDHPRPDAEILFDMKLKTRGNEEELIPLADFIGVKGIKAKGKKLTAYPVKRVNLLEPAIELLPEVEQREEITVEPDEETAEEPEVEEQEVEEPVKEPVSKGRKKKIDDPEG